jgi:hypothetical protein
VLHPFRQHCSGELTRDDGKRRSPKAAGPWRHAWASGSRPLPERRPQLVVEVDEVLVPKQRPIRQRHLSVLGRKPVVDHPADDVHDRRLATGRQHQARIRSPTDPQCDRLTGPCHAAASAARGAASRDPDPANLRRRERDSYQRRRGRVRAIHSHEQVASQRRPAGTQLAVARRRRAPQATFPSIGQVLLVQELRPRRYPRGTVRGRYGGLALDWRAGGQEPNRR